MVRGWVKEASFWERGVRHVVRVGLACVLGLQSGPISGGGVGAGEERRNVGGEGGDVLDSFLDYRNYQRYKRSGHVVVGVEGYLAGTLIPKEATRATRSPITPLKVAEAVSKFCWNTLTLGSLLAAAVV